MLRPETEALVEARAAAAGISPDTLIREALAARAAKDELIARMEEISARCAALPSLDARCPDKILGYDAFGLPRSSSTVRP